MMSLKRETLALRLRQNWMARYPPAGVFGIPGPAVNPPTTGASQTTVLDALDDSLTSLNWLQNLNIMKVGGNEKTGGVAMSAGDATTAATDGGPCTPPSSPAPDDDPTSDMRVNPNAILNMACQIKSEPAALGAGLYRSYSYSGGGFDGSTGPLPPYLYPHHLHGHHGSLLDRIDYKTNASIKPPYSYATLICMAMKETDTNKITLSGIYGWIVENFRYYKHADPSWQNSIRHNLSLNKCFQKVARRKDEPGKGGFWRINPEYADSFVDGVFKKRRGSPGVGANSRDCYAKRVAATNAANAAAQLLREQQQQQYDESAAAAAGLLGDTAAGGCGSAAYAALSAIDGGGCPGESNNPRVIVKKEPELQQQLMEISALQQQQQQQQQHGACLMDDDAQQQVVRRDLGTWSALLSQDIEVNGVAVKAEQIIDGDLPLYDANQLTQHQHQQHQQQANSAPFSGVDISGILTSGYYMNGTGAVIDGGVAASPITSLSPPPSDSNSDTGLEDILNGDFGLDLDNGNPMDFTTGDALDLTVSGTGLQPPDWWNESLSRSLWAGISPAESPAPSVAPLTPMPGNDAEPRGASPPSDTFSIPSGETPQQQHPWYDISASAADALHVKSEIDTTTAARGCTPTMDLDLATLLDFHGGSSGAAGATISGSCVS